MGKIILYLALIVIGGHMAAGANFWVNDPNDCPLTYLSQGPIPGKVVCGESGGTVFFFDPANINASSSIQSTETDQDGGGFNGGYLVDCYDYESSPDAAFCDNNAATWCDLNSSCFDSPVYRKTNCTASVFGESYCGQCRTGRYNCYGDTNCESTSTSDCNGGSGKNNKYTVSTCDDQTGGGTCVCDSGAYECDGVIDDEDGCEFVQNDPCSSGTGTYTFDECLDASNANCTSASNSDCNDDDSDGDLTTCNSGDGCEITGSGSCDSGHGTWASSQCFGATGNCTATSGWLDCDNNDADGDIRTCNGNGCEFQNGSSCSVGSLPGTRVDCDCVIDNVEYGNSSVQYNWSGPLPFVWIVQYGSGLVFNLSHNVSGNNLTFGADGLCINQQCLLSWAAVNQSGGGGGSNWALNNTALINQSSLLTYNKTYFDGVYLDDTDTNTQWSINNSGLINQSGELTINLTTIDDRDETGTGGNNNTVRYNISKNEENVTIVFY